MFHLVLFSLRLQNILFDGPSVNNKQKFQEYLVQQSLGWKRMFPRNDLRCDAGGCQKIVQTELQTLDMPAGMKYMVGTNSNSVALGVNFNHRGTY